MAKDSEDTSAYRCGDGYRCSGPVLEWRNHLDDRFRASDRGTGHYRPAIDADELRRSRTAHGQAVRGRRILLLGRERRHFPARVSYLIHGRRGRVVCVEMTAFYRLTLRLLSLP